MPGVRLSRREANGTGAGDAKPNPDKNGEIARLIDRFFIGSAEQAAPYSGQLPAGIRLMIATVPDPRHTHLSLQFDRTLEAIQQAAQDERYTYDSSWLPWKTERIEYCSLADRNAEMKEARGTGSLPGADAVPEKHVGGARRPTARMRREARRDRAMLRINAGCLSLWSAKIRPPGLNRMQWDNALHWIDEHASKNRADKALRVLGPNFSGSMPSVVRAA